LICWTWRSTFMCLFNYCSLAFFYSAVHFRDLRFHLLSHLLWYTLNINHHIQVKFVKHMKVDLQVQQDETRVSMLHINFSVNVNIRLWDINTSGHVHIQMYLDIRHLFNIIFSINFCVSNLRLEFLSHLWKKDSYL
jgi:acyl-CoA thioesterase FadM